MNDVYVFLGPSLPVDQARQILDATYLPPVSCGDVTELLLDRPAPTMIGIVDGLFEQVPSVWHKEILFAIDRGTRVFGASSMGALRAAELHDFGMIGVGEVFEAFRESRYEDDDEVALVHASAEDGYQPLSEAMVNLRAGLTAALDTGAISRTAHDALLADAKQTFYAERSWARLYASASGLGVSEDEVKALSRLVAEQRPDVKRDDALAMLRAMRDDTDASPRPTASSFDFEPTYYWEKLVRFVRHARVEREVRERWGVSAAELFSAARSQAPESIWAALTEVLVRQEVERLGLLSPSDMAPPGVSDAHGRSLGEVGEDESLQTLVDITAHHLRSELLGPLTKECARQGSAADLFAIPRAPAGDESDDIPRPRDRGE
ncbi:TfuA-like protein [Streptomyces sp. NPDC005402]|uniref:TfuA-like protein n=1 Tax=Streptomyces sp. NPDC005402 TaxID=3155338 RepID=UPI0033B255C0